MDGTTRGMSQSDLEKLERIARNFPLVSDLEMERADCPFGEIFIAYGRDGNGHYHGIWGINGVARTAMFKKELSKEDVQWTLLTDAQEYCALAAPRGMFEEGWWNRGH